MNDWNVWLTRWADAGLIDAAAAARIRDYETEHAGSGKLRWPAMAAIAFGALMLGGGVLLFVAAHWDALSPGARFAIVLTMVGGFHVLGALVGEQRARAVGGAARRRHRGPRRRHQPRRADLQPRRALAVGHPRLGGRRSRGVGGAAADSSGRPPGDTRSRLAARRVERSRPVSLRLDDDGRRCGRGIHDGPDLFHARRAVASYRLAASTAVGWRRSAAAGGVAAGLRVRAQLDGTRPDRVPVRSRREPSAGPRQSAFR